MIKRKAEMSLEQKNVWNGQGMLNICKVFTPEELGGRADLFNVVALQPGQSIGLHGHTTDSEVYYVLEGQLTVTDNGVEAVLEAGEAMFTAEGGTHSGENRTDKDVKVLAVIFPH